MADVGAPDLDPIRICSHGRGLRWPAEIWIGVTDNRWPIEVFTKAEHAAAWVGGDVEFRHAYRVIGQPVAEALFVPPTLPKHKVVDIRD